MTTTTPTPTTKPTIKPTTRLLALAGALLAVPLLLLGLLAPGASGTAAHPGAGSDRPIIVRVTGDAANGFGIFYANGSSIFPPTDSESMAECSEYDSWRQRIVCRTEVRTWYRDLGDMKRSLAYVRKHG